MASGDKYKEATEATNLLNGQGRKSSTTMRRILIPIDNSKDSLRSYHWYVKHLCRPGDYIIFTHIIPPVYTRGFSLRTFPTSTDDSDSCQESHSSIVAGQRLCNEYKSLTRDLTGVKSKAVIQAAIDPEDGVLEAVRIHAIQLVVIGSRGLGMIKRLFLGSMTDTLLHNVHVPVAVVPPALPEGEDPEEKEVLKKNKKKSGKEGRLRRHTYSEGTSQDPSQAV